MTKRDFSYPSKDGSTEIHAIAWEPQGEPRAVLQIAHGMVEYIDRYDPFASFLAEAGFYVVGNDHLGHGQSIREEEQLGFFGEPDGNQFVIGDMHQLRKQTEAAYPGLPYFLLGHSMGSFLARQYITLYGAGLEGVIIMGTGYQSAATLRSALLLCKLIGGTRGWHHRSEFINNLALGSYNKAYEPARTGDDWLTRDEAIVDSYQSDPLCQFRFTVNGYYHLFRGLQRAQDPQNIAKIPKDLPILVTSGADDAVGNQGEGPKKVTAIYQEAGIRDVTCQLYPEDRHEILNELDREQVNQDLLTWMEERMRNKQA